MVSRFRTHQQSSHAADTNPVTHQCIPLRYASCIAQFVTRIDQELADEIDRLVGVGFVASRSAAVRLALEELVDRHRRRQIGQEIIAGYERIPQTEDEIAFADESTRSMIADEPW